MLKITGLSKESALKLFKVDNNKVVEFGGRANKMVKSSFKSKKSKNKKFRNSTWV